MAEKAFRKVDSGKDDDMQKPEHDEYGADEHSAEHHSTVAMHHKNIGEHLEAAAEGHHALAEQHESMSNMHREKMATMLQNEAELRKGV